MDMMTLAMAKAYTDSKRLAWVEAVTMEYLPGTEYDLRQYYDDYGIGVFLATEDAIQNAYNMMRERTEHGKREIPVTVEINGTAYDTSMTYVYDDAFAVSAVHIGNVDGAKNPEVLREKEPFYIETQGAVSQLLLLGANQTCTVRIFEKTETIHPIDPKYLPEEVKPNVIDLTQYNAVDEGGVSCSFNDVVLDLFAKGGGNSKLQHDGSFWQDVSRGGNMRIMIDAADVNGLVIEIKPGSLVRYADGTLNAVEISMILSTVDYWARVTVIFANDIVNDKTKVFVFTEPV